MKRLEFTCEGCDLTRYITLLPGGTTDVTLDGWVAHHVVMQENGSVIFDTRRTFAPPVLRKCVTPSIQRTGQGWTPQ